MNKDERKILIGRGRSVFSRLSCIGVAVLMLCCVSLVHADWPHWGGSLNSTKYVPYEEIHAGNIDSLRILWRYRLPVIGGDGGDTYKGTPIVVDGVLYTRTPDNLALALDAVTGTELWRFDAGGQDAGSNNRGIAHWRGEGGQSRILFGTMADTLYSLDAETGLPDRAFGAGGRVDLTQGMRAPVMDADAFGLASPPTVVGDVVIVGSLINDWHDGTSPDLYTAPGDVRGYDVRTGELLWTFHTIPQPGEAYYDEWPDNSWDYFGSANVWATISADEELGIAYLPVSSVSHDRYGGERLGRNLFSDCLVAVDARTGERLWHYQFIHHTLWNYDPPAAPVLLDVVVDGKPRKVVVQVTKQAFAYVLDRVTGEPIWPIEEHPVPQSDVPGEESWPSQPFPTKPAPFDRQGLSVDDLIDFTPELRDEALAIVGNYKYGPLYTAPSLQGTIQVPGELGGADWVGASADPKSGVLFVPSKTMPFSTELNMISDPTTLSAYGGVAAAVNGPRGLPLTKPPYSRITAIDMNSGEHLWMRPIGTGPVNHPALRGVDGVPEQMGWTQRAFLLTTPTLLFATTDSPSSTGSGYFVDRDANLHAYDKNTGDLLTRIPLPDNTGGGLISYVADGRQFIATTLGGNRADVGEIVALAVPRVGESVPPQAWTGYPAEHPRFDEAVALIDAGDVTSLTDLLDAEPTLLTAKGFQDPLFPIPSLESASLIHLAAGSDRAPVPDNISAIIDLLLDRGADLDALTADSTSALDLVVASQQLGWKGIRSDKISILLERGATAGPKLMWNALVGPTPKRESFPDGHFQIAQDLYTAGIPVDLPFAAALGLVDVMAEFVDNDGELSKSASAQYRPHVSGSQTDQQVLDLALSYAAYGGQQEAVDWLLARGANINGHPVGFFDWKELDVFSPILTAIYADDGDMVRHLANRGADLTLQHANFGFTPVWLTNFLSRMDAKSALMEAMEEE
jgi:quinoprotein glucose dehydrogenase